MTDAAMSNSSSTAETASKFADLVSLTALPFRAPSAAASTRATNLRSPAGVKVIDRIECARRPLKRTGVVAEVFSPTAPLRFRVAHGVGELTRGVDRSRKADSTLASAGSASAETGFD